MFMINNNTLNCLEQFADIAQAHSDGDNNLWLIKIW